MKGIILIAAGANYYGKMAHQLVTSLRVTSPGIPVALIYNDTAIQYDVDLTAFDITIPSPIDAGHWLKLKTLVYDLSPFDETIYIDVDMISLKNFSQLFDQLADTDFTMQNSGFVDLTGDVVQEKYTWGNIHEIKTMHKLSGNFYNLQSEFMYFKKSRSVKKLFDEAKKVFDKPKASFRTFAGGVPDEFAFAVAMCKTGIYPHTAPFTPIYWETAQQKKLYRDRTLLFDNYFGFSVGGHVISQYALDCYFDIANNQWKKLGLPGRPMAQNKRKLVPGRESA